MSLCFCTCHLFHDSLVIFSRVLGTFVFSAEILKSASTEVVKLYVVLKRHGIVCVADLVTIHWIGRRGGDDILCERGDGKINLF